MKLAVRRRIIRKQLRKYTVEILTNKSNGVLYIGITNDLERCLSEHRQKKIAGFTAQYNVTKLVYYETYDDAESAISREKTLKGWLRSKKNELIAIINPDWDDLSKDWYQN